ncbi:nitrate reductase molybdenum cofactor assembly chaperone [Amycolatopsis decaplanina]|uniref:Respiratory nitrate reductase chaperone NarJ n=1 Tax=Amycolatopsis decaplanina DSM 44594 TaxID=1284240 RepID=M2YMC5_9PSEU|nr:nitrate reductase molybdenum cofactor assembly chaperone [Amycolatopsis decaplanina]EME55857.1 respiratory nitrate reductase chaperone NarJ [Amycolatopsis decaplanina DSM 44594]
MTLTDTHHATAWQVQSLTLSYPDEEFVGRLPLLRAAIRTLPAPLTAPLTAFFDHVAATPLTDLAASYVATFDHRKRFSPYLTYFAYGDTRKRGMALLRFKHAYRAAGLELDDGELPDHLAVVLEFAATGDPVVGRRLMLEHRAGLELIRLGLRETGSPWAHVLESVSATLPPLGKREHEAIARLATEGPPEEEVGLAPFAPPEYMPRPQGGS